VSVIILTEHHLSAVFRPKEVIDSGWNIWAVGQTSSGLAQTTEPPVQKRLVVNEVVVGPFKEEEEGTSIASDV